jgi:hypothetical protein
MTQSEIEPATFRLVALCLYQLRNRVPQSKANGKYNFMRPPLCRFTFYTSEYKLRTFKYADHYANCSKVPHPLVWTFDSVAQNKIPHVVVPDYMIKQEDQWPAMAYLNSLLSFVKIGHLVQLSKRGDRNTHADSTDTSSAYLLMDKK